MEKRKIGRSPLEVSAVGLGLMSMSGVYGNANDEESISLIHYALDKGINLLDSADMYGWGTTNSSPARPLKGWPTRPTVPPRSGRRKTPAGNRAATAGPGTACQAAKADLNRRA